MPDRSRKRKKRPAAAKPLAGSIVEKGLVVDQAPLIDEATGDTLFEQPLVDKGKNPAAVALGRLGGLKGGKARAAKLGKAKLSAIAKKATRARWKKKG